MNLDLIVRSNLFECILQVWFHDSSDIQILKYVVMFASVLRTN